MAVPAHVEAELAVLSSLPARVADLEKKIAGPVSYARSLHPVPQSSGAPPANAAAVAAAPVACQIPPPQALSLPPPLCSPQKKDREATYVKKAVVPEVDEEGFEKVRGRKQRRRSQKKRIKGEMTGCKLQGAPEPWRDVYVGRVLPSFDVQDIKEHAAHEGLYCLEVEKVSSETARLSSFRVRVRRVDAAAAMMGRNWPIGSVVGKFYPPVPARQPRDAAGAMAKPPPQASEGSDAVRPETNNAASTDAQDPNANDGVLTNPDGGNATAEAEAAAAAAKDDAPRQRTH